MKKTRLKAGWRWACPDKTKSPAIGVPVYLKDEAVEKHNFPREHRGGVILEDWSLIDPKGNLHQGFVVKHKIGNYLWDAEDLVEIGGVKLTFEEE